MTSFKTASFDGTQIAAALLDWYDRHVDGPRQPIGQAVTPTR